MAQQRDMSGEIFATEESAGRGYLIGRTLSRIFHPILLNILTFVIVGYYALASPAQGLKWAGICVLLQVLPPTIFYIVRARQGAFADEDVSVRQQRNELYLVGFVTVLADALILIPLGLPRPFVALLVCGLALGIFGGLINLFWKISIHAASIASTATVALLFSQRWGIVLWLCAAAIGWARVRTRNHSPLQVIAGFALAASVVLVVFQLVV